MEWKIIVNQIDDVRIHYFRQIDTKKDHVYYLLLNLAVFVEIYSENQIRNNHKNNEQRIV